MQHKDSESEFKKLCFETYFTVPICAKMHKQNIVKIFWQKCFTKERLLLYKLSITWKEGVNAKLRKEYMKALFDIDK